MQLIRCVNTWSRKQPAARPASRPPTPVMTPLPSPRDEDKEEDDGSVIRTAEGNKVPTPLASIYDRIKLKSGRYEGGGHGLNPLFGLKMRIEDEIIYPCFFRLKSRVAVRSLPFSKVEIIDCWASCGALKFAPIPCNRITEPVFTTQSQAKSQIVSALHVIVHGECVVKTDIALFADQKHF